MKAYCRLTTLASLMLVLSGCSNYITRNYTYGNNENRYLKEQIIERPALQLPKTAHPSKITPRFLIPKGQSVYPAGGHVNIKPPGFYDKYTRIASSKPSPKSAPKPLSKKAQIKYQINKIEAEIHAMKGGKNTKVAKASPEKITAILKFNKQNRGLITIDAPQATAWAAVENALKQTNYKILKSQADKGIFTVQAAGQKGDKDKFLVYVMKKASVSQVAVFDLNGKLATGNDAYSLIEQIKANL